MAYDDADLREGIVSFFEEGQGRAKDIKMGLTREDLNRMWTELRVEAVRDGDVCVKLSAVQWLLVAERSFIDRETQAKAMRWAADHGCTLGSSKRVRALADRIETGEVEVPK